MRLSAKLGVALTAALAVAAAVSAPAAPAPSAPVPGGEGTVSPGRTAVYTFDAPDPFVLRDDDQYYAYTTNAGTPWGGVQHLPVLQSSDLATWHPVGDGFPNLPGWVQPGRTWAPSVSPSGDGFVLFYAAMERSSGRQCIGKARSRRPTGPFRDTRRGPVVCQRSLGGSIDPYLFQDRDGARYLLWKNDGNCCGLGVSLWGQRLGADDRLTGRPQRLLSYDRSWERPLIENPALVRSPDRGGPYHLFYAANWYESASYATGLARCSSPLGPCRKITTNAPWHGSTAHALGPGGAAFFTDTAGRNWMGLHGWARPPGLVGYAIGARRSLFIEKVDFSGTGPRVNTSYPYAYHRDAPHPFVDVPAAADAAVAWAFAQGVVSGYRDGPDLTFRPGLLVRRATAVALLRLALDTPVDDLDRPEATITRGEVALLLYTAAGAPPVDDTGYDHPLTDVPSTLRDPVRWIVHDPDGTGPERPVTTGFADLTFRPTLTVDRAGYVGMLYRMLTSA